MTDAAVEVVSLTPRTLREVVEDNVRRVARACGVPRRGTRLQKTLWNRLVQIKEAVERRRRLDGWGADDPIFSLPKPPTVLLLEWLDPPFDGGHWIPDMIGAAGANCANARWRDEGPRRSSVKSHEISWDDVERSDPDTLVVACCGFDTQRNASDALREWRRWGRLRCAATAEAAASREVYEECEMSVGGVWAVDGDRYFARPGPMLVHGVALLALCAHSRRHPDLLHDLLELDWVDREWIEKGCRRIDAEAPVHPGETAADPAAENDMEDFVSIHDRACAKQETFYVDPASRYRVFTEYAHLQRGKCCGSGCRHCPYGHENVKDDDSKAARIQQPAVLAKGEAPSLPEHSLHPSEHDQSKVLFWSGGKDSFLAVRALARQAQEQAAQFSTSGPPSDGQKCRGFGVILLTTFDATSGTVAHQEMPVTTIVRQARHLGLMLVGVPMHRRSSEPYVNRIRRALDLIERKLGIRVSSLVFGDLHLAHVVEWRKEHLSKLGLYRLEFPLYRRSYDELLCDLKASGVTCVVTASTIDAVLAGELYDADLMRQRLVLGAASSASIASGEVYDVMGENGEFHTEAQVWTVDRDRAFGFLTA
jgi:ATP-binding cassette subfamily B (MDR/TAP) protein 1